MVLVGLRDLEMVMELHLSGLNDMSQVSSQSASRSHSCVHRNWELGLLGLWLLLGLGLGAAWPDIHRNPRQNDRMYNPKIHQVCQYPGIIQRSIIQE